MKISSIRGLWCGIAGATTRADHPTQAQQIHDEAIALTTAYLNDAPLPSLTTLCTMPLGLLHPLTAADDLRETISTLAVDDPAPYLAAATIIMLADSDISPDAYLHEILTLCDGMSRTFDQTLLRIGHVLGWGSRRHALKHLTSDTSLASAIAVSLYAILRFPDDTRTALDCAAASPVHQAETLALTGAYIGTRDGQTALPQAWQAACHTTSDGQPLIERMATYEPN